MTDPRGPAVRFGTRGSALARAQAERVLGRFAELHPAVPAEPVIVRTEGDVDKTTPLTVIGGQGVFTSALEEALLARTIDAAVHSAKDLPSRTAPGLDLIAFPEREDPADVLVSRHGRPLDALPPNPVVGTSSRRRALQVRLARPDARIVPIRGNLDTRLRQALTAELDAIVLAAAGIARMGWTDRVTQRLPLDRFVPSPGQGAVAVETRADDAAVRALLLPLDDPAVGRAVRAERAFLRAIGAGCLTPVGALVTDEGGRWKLRAMLGGEEGDAVEWAEEWLDHIAPEAHAAAVAVRLFERLRAARTTHPAPGLANGKEAPAGHSDRLAGVRVVVTRARDQAAPLVAALRAAGAEPVECPTIRVEDPADRGPLDRALARAADGRYDWVVFTSPNAVRRVFDRLGRLGMAPDRLGTARVAAVGAGTARALEGAGVRVDLVPERALGEALVEALGLAGVAGARVLYPKGDLARDAVPDGLAAAGATVDAVEAYRTVPETGCDPRARERIRGGEVDVLTFASPSSVRNLIGSLGGDSGAVRSVPAVCVGPVTAAAARELGFHVGAVADDASVAGLIAAIERCAAVGVAPEAGRLVAAGADAGEGEVGA